MFIAREKFEMVIANTPLVSIDLLIQRENGDILLGYRRNRPAQGYWFVPGGRICKNESIEVSFSRLTKNELGQVYLIERAKLYGVYDHFYCDSVFDESLSTHYVVIAYRLIVESLPNLPFVQHSEYRWFTVEELLVNDNVHANTKIYFSAAAETEFSTIPFQ